MVKIADYGKTLYLMKQYKATFPGNIPLGTSLKNFLADKGMLQVASSVLHQVVQNNNITNDYVFRFNFLD